MSIDGQVVGGVDSGSVVGLVVEVGVRRRGESGRPCLANGLSGEPVNHAVRGVVGLEDDASSFPSAPLDVVVDAVVRSTRRWSPSGMDCVALVGEVLPLRACRHHLALRLELELERHRGAGRGCDLLLGFRVLIVNSGLFGLVRLFLVAATEYRVDGRLRPVAPHQSGPLEHAKLHGKVIGHLLGLHDLAGSWRGYGRKLELSEFGSDPARLGLVVLGLVVLHDVNKRPIREPGRSLEGGMEVERIELDDAGVAVVGAGGRNGSARHGGGRGRVTARDRLEGLGLS